MVVMLDGTGERLILILSSQLVIMDVLFMEVRLKSDASEKLNHPNSKTKTNLLTHPEGRDSMRFYEGANPLEL